MDKTTALALLQNEDATVTEIAQSEKDLRKALADIVLLPTDGAKTEFDSIVKEAEALKEADYTSESWAALQAAIKEAKEICKDATKVSQVEAAKKKVDEAMAALVEVVKDPVVTPSEEPGASPSANPGTNPSASLKILLLEIKYFKKKSLSKISLKKEQVMIIIFL